jgi:hypothetical protein
MKIIVKAPGLVQLGTGLEIWPNFADARVFDDDGKEIDNVKSISFRMSDDNTDPIVATIEVYLKEIEVECPGEIKVSKP